MDSAPIGFSCWHLTRTVNFVLCIEIFFWPGGPRTRASARVVMFVTSKQLDGCVIFGWVAKNPLGQWGPTSWSEYRNYLLDTIGLSKPLSFTSW